MSDFDLDSSLHSPLLYISARDLAAPLFRRKRVVLTIFLIGLVITGAASVLLSPKFISHMTVLVDRERIDPLVTTGATTQLITAGDPISEDEIDSEAELLKSGDLLEKVVVANQLQELHERSLLGRIHSAGDKVDRIAFAVRTLAENLKIEIVPKTDLINVTYSSSDPRLSYSVLNSLGTLYLEKHAAVHRPVGSYEFFSQETQKYQQALEDSENRLRSFEGEQGAAAPDLERTGLVAQITNSIGQLHSTEASIAADEQRISSDERYIKITPQRSTTKRDVNSANLLLEQLGSTLLAAQIKRTQLLSKYSSDYPLVREADQEVADAEAAIAKAERSPYVNEETDRDSTFDFLSQDLAKTEADLAGQRANLRVIKRSIQSMRGQMVDLDEKAVTQQDLLRDVKSNEDSYLLYVSKREQERTSDALDKARISNVAIAVPPSIPVLPTYSLISFVATGISASLIFAIVIAYVIEYFDPSFHTPGQVADRLGIPIVVAVSKIIA
jgi:uncharacterized protein involved in exopolysaccharide biosynthesis